MNNLTFFPLCEKGVGRADIEESKSDVAMNAWPPQASYPCGNFSDTSSLNVRGPKGSLGLSFHCFHSYWKWKSNQLLPLNSTSDFRSLWADLGSPVLSFNRCAAPAKLPTWQCPRRTSARRPWILEMDNRVSAVANHVSKTTLKVVVSHCCLRSHLCCTNQVISQCQTRVKLNRVFFPRRYSQARSLGCGFAR